ncbi:MAG: PTS sugar transporter subunit IIB [Candidatus Hodarchaeales archaeon]
MKKILVACGTSIATATVVATKIKELLRENKIQASITQCKSFEVKSKVNYQKYDLVVSTTKVSGEKTVNGVRMIKEVPILNGIPYLTGMKKKELDEEVLKYLKQ